jgi:hypothetical protein
MCTLWIWGDDFYLFSLFLLDSSSVITGILPAWVTEVCSQCLADFMACSRLSIIVESMDEVEVCTPRPTPCGISTKYRRDQWPQALHYLSIG